MWEIDIGNQLWGIVASLILGIGLCVLYDILRAHRKIFKIGIVAVSLADIAFWLVCTFFTFIYFLVFTNGEIRGYLLLGELSGFIACRLTLSKILYKVFCFLFGIIHTVLKKIEWLLSVCSAKILRICKKILKILKKAFNYLKKLLKSVTALLYTKQDTDTENSES